MDLPLLLEGWPIASVESRISALERMARPPKPLDEPPIVRLDGYVPHSDLAWVVQRITWGETIRGENGQRVRQFLTLGLIKYIEEDRVQQGNARVTAQANASVKGGGKKPHIVKEGETMRGIAQKELGNSDRYQEIMKLNNIRDPKSIKVNQSLRLP
jgi:nucleoid-associated protein YgaU